VAVKIRHPHVEEETFVDIDLIFAFINTLGESCGHFSIPFKKEEFHLVLQRQIDFRFEGYNLQRFCNNFHSAPPVAPCPSPSSSTKSQINEPSPPDASGAEAPTRQGQEKGADALNRGGKALNRWRSEALPVLSEGVSTAGGRGGAGAGGGVCFPQVGGALLSHALLVIVFLSFYFSSRNTRL
jgi:hypothetical protein